MRICFFGNQGNKNYHHCRCARKRGHEAELFLLESGDATRSDPTLLDPALADSWPAWITRMPKPEDSDIRLIEDRFDIVVASGNRATREACRFDPGRIPLVLSTTGPMNVDVEKQGAASRERRISLERAAAITTAHPMTLLAVKDAGFLDKVRFHLPVQDITLLREAVDTRFLQELRETYAPYETVFCWFSRNILDPADSSYKGPERFLRAAERFVTARPERVRFVFGCHGPEADTARRRIEESVLKEWTDVIDHQPLGRLLAYLSLENGVVFDNLAQATVSSGLFRDAMTMGAILVRHTDREKLDLAYGRDCPVIDAHSVDTCVEQMTRLHALDADERDSIRAAARDWAMRCLNWTAHFDRFEGLLRDVLLIRQTLERGEYLRSMGGEG